MDGDYKFSFHIQNITPVCKLQAKLSERSEKCISLKSPVTLSLPLSLQRSCPTSSVSLWTRTRPSFRSTPSHHCRCEASAWLQSEVYSVINVLIVTRSHHPLRCWNAAAALHCWSSVGKKNPRQQKMLGEIMWFSFLQIWLSSRTKYMQLESFLYFFISFIFLCLVLLTRTMYFTNFCGSFNPTFPKQHLLHCALYLTSSNSVYKMCNKAVNRVQTWQQSQIQGWQRPDSSHLLEGWFLQL